MHHRGVRWVPPGQAVASRAVGVSVSISYLSNIVTHFLFSAYLDPIAIPRAVALFRRAEAGVVSFRNYLRFPFPYDIGGIVHLAIHPFEIRTFNATYSGFVTNTALRSAVQACS